MLHPTPRLLLRPTALWGGFKLHQPLPLTARESRQLLEMLTSSFRQQLEKEHGPYGPHPKAAKSERRIPTDRHLHAILTDPLFHTPTYSRNISKDPNLRRDPMEVFDDACAQGLMNIDHATVLLYAKKSLIISSSAPSIRDGMKESGAGKKVLKWIISHGIAKSSEFFGNKRTFPILLEFLVAEDLQEIVWVWLENSLRFRPHRDRTVKLLLSSLVKAEASGFVSLDAAYQCLLRASDLIVKMDAPFGGFLRDAGTWLSEESAKFPTYRPAVSADSYNAFLALVPSFMDHPDAHLALLHVHHPTTPSADLALAYLRLVYQKLVLETSSGVQVPNLNHWLIITLGLDTAHYLLEHDKSADAHWVMDFLRRFYPREVGANEKGWSVRSKARAKAEAASLERLEGLELA